MGCAKDGNLKDFKSINQTAKEYQARQEEQADKTIQACLQGKLTERQAKEALAKQFGHFRDRRGFQKAIEKLEQELRAQREDEYGRRDYILEKDVYYDKDGLKAGIHKGPRPGEAVKIIQDKNDPIVQSTHLHIHPDGTTITTHYWDDRTESYNFDTGEQERDVDYSKSKK